MLRLISFLKAPGRLLLVFLFISLAPNAGYPFSPPRSPGSGSSRSLSQRLRIFTVLQPADDLYRRPEVFTSLQTAPAGDPMSYYWLRTDLHTVMFRTPARFLSFTHLTYVDIYLYTDSGGAGRRARRSEISPEDGRLYSTPSFEAGKDYTLLIQVHHTKHYQPVFDFQLQPRRKFSRRCAPGSPLTPPSWAPSVLLLMYTLLSWAVSRYRPYAWLSIFIAGIGLYVFSSGGYWIEWFSPEDPASGWLLNAHFLHAGMFGLYLLVTDAWRIRTDFPRLYTWVRWIPWFLGATTITTFCIDYWSATTISRPSSTVSNTR